MPRRTTYQKVFLEISLTLCSGVMSMTAELIQSTMGTFGLLSLAAVWPPRLVKVGLLKPLSMPIVFTCHFVMQTSVNRGFIAGESKKKYCALVKIHRKSFKLEKIPLKTVRPFYFEDICLSATDIKADDVFHEKKVLKFCRERVEHLLQRAKEEFPHHK